MRWSNIGWAVCCGIILAGCQEVPLPESLDEIRAAERRDPNWEKLRGIKVLTLTEAQRIAEENNPDYQATFFAVTAAKMRYFQAVGAYSPEISGNFEVGQSILNRDGIVNPFPTTVPYSNLFTTAATLRASWLLFDGLSRELNVLASRSDVRISQSQRVNVLRVLRRAVAFAYYDVLLAGAMEEIAISDIMFQESSLNQASVRYNSGFIAKGDWLSFKIDLNTARSRKIQAVQQKAVAKFALAALMGYPDGRLPESMQLTGIADAVTKPELGVDFYLNEALVRRPDLKEAREFIDYSRYRKYQGLSSYAPVISAWGEVGYGTRFGRYRNYDFDHSYWNRFDYGYGISGDWLIFNGFMRYNRYRELKELYEQSRVRFLQKQIEVLNEVETAYTIYRASGEIAVLYRETMKWVFEQRNLINAEYWAGNVTITRLRGAQNDLVNAEGNLAVSLIEMGKAEAQLEAAINGKVELAPPDMPRTVPVLDQLFKTLEKKFGE